jgi:hypothetical protein
MVLEHPRRPFRKSLEYRFSVQEIVFLYRLAENIMRGRSADFFPSTFPDQKLPESHTGIKLQWSAGHRALKVGDNLVGFRS